MGELLHFQLTALDFDGAKLPVHWEILQVHRARGRDGQPVVTYQMINKLSIDLDSAKLLISLFILSGAALLTRP